jgi:alpha-D-ribose 1-methylphosphonate 5-triphosphate synthase subunit PhnH
LGLSAVFIDQWADNHARYPLGVDALLAGDKALAGLPRSTSLTTGAP